MQTLLSNEGQPLWDDGEFVVEPFSENGKPGSLLAVRPALAQPPTVTVRRLEHAYALRDLLDSSWAARPVRMVRDRGRHALIIERPVPDLSLLATSLGEPWEIGRFLRVALGLSVALGRLHARGLVHKDIKPSHVFVAAGSGQVWLSGFGVTSRVPRERQAPEPPDVIVGTLAYMAPEQTGRMNRSVDARSDLYACGVTFYEMLTGTLPFSATEPMEWIHCHVARPPREPGERVPGIPVAASAIVLKLLAKNAEDRYQTAAGLEADLRRCVVQWNARGQIDPFPLGENDIPDRLVIPETLYGREAEIATLGAAFERVVNGRAPELLLVSGYSGVGKSSLVNELQKALVPPRALFASGKFDQYQRDIPCAPFAQAFQVLVRHILGRSASEVERWRGAIQDAVGPNGTLLVSMLPELSLVIGVQPAVPELPPAQAQARFQTTFRRFVHVFAAADHPLVLFLDDLQWLDAASLQLLEHLVTHPDTRHLLCIGAFRDHEVSPSHPLTQTLSAIRSTGTVVHDLVLKPLSPSDMQRLVSGALSGVSPDAPALAELVHSKTGGNPFFAIQFLAALADEQLLTFDSERRTWHAHLAAIRTKGFTANVVDLMVRRLHRLPARSQTALQQLACLGNTVAIDIAARARGVAVEELHADIWEAVQAGVLLRQEGSYRFLHDRVQEAAYSLIPADERAERHLAVGRRLLETMTAAELAEHVFDVTNQLNLGAAHIDAGDEREQVADLNRRAGRKALAATAYASAHRYFSHGQSMLRDDAWERSYELAFDLSLGLAEAQFVTGQLADAERLLGALLPRARSPLHASAVHIVAVELHLVASDYAKAVASALACLRLFAVDMPVHPTSAEVNAEDARVWRQLGDRSVESLVDLPRMIDPGMMACMRVLSSMAAPAFFTDGHLHYFVLARMVNLTLEYGSASESTLGYAWYGLFGRQRYGRHAEAELFAKLATDLIDRHAFTQQRAMAIHSMEMAAIWSQPIDVALAHGARAFRAAVDTGDLSTACFAITHRTTNRLLRGDSLDELWREALEHLAFVRRTGFRDGADTIVSQIQYIQAMRGMTTSLSSFTDDQFDAPAFEATLAHGRMPTMICWHWILRTEASFLAGEYDDALRTSDAASEWLWASNGLIQQLNFHYFTALTLADLERTQPDRGHRARLDGHLAQLRDWAGHCSAAFQDKAALVSAEVAWLEGRELEAERLYEEAIQLAADQGFLQYEGLAYERAARFYAGRGFAAIAGAYLRNARHAYLRWGAAGKVRQIDLAYPDGREEHSPIAARTIGTAIQDLDLATVLQLAQTLSGDIVLETLIRRLMEMVLEHAGAERALLMRPEGERIVVAAVAETGRDAIAVRVPAPADRCPLYPESVLAYVMRTQQSLVLDDASAGGNLFSSDEYIVRMRVRSLLCVPLVHLGRVNGVIYLENNVASRAFTPACIALLKVLAAQAAISLENARLYSDLRVSENRLRSAIDTIPVIVASATPDGSAQYINRHYQEYTGLPSGEGLGHSWGAAIHPDDLPRMRERWETASAAGTPFEAEARMQAADGTYRWFVHRARPLRDEHGAIVSWYAAAHDIDDQRRAEERVRQDELELRQLVDVIPHLISTVAPDGQLLYINRAAREYFGLTLEQLLAQEDPLVLTHHPEDRVAQSGSRRRAVEGDGASEFEVRLRRRDGQYRWHLIRYEPLRDAAGRIVRWYVTGTDVDDRKRTEERVKEENVVLREQVAQVSMFEEIVGVSHPIRVVLSHVTKVAPTESTVLITGETGTGKELIARAIHKRSQRAARAFIGVNCAAIPAALIPSELFGHEKGAFTGALQRRLGRFELAEGGTLFLDEIGELPLETQVTLLRVLQEREFERVGGSRAIQADVRVIAATNRDLKKAVAAGTFRSDLFYRLNVFPVEVPSLRERQDDIPLLVAYFVERFARNAGKKIRGITKESLDLLLSYPWPGNIRELQNVIERSLIVCDSDTLSVDERWLVSDRPAPESPQPALADIVNAKETALIEAALAETRGRVSGPSGAAARLGMRPSTLESKIKALGIDKRAFSSK